VTISHSTGGLGLAVGRLSRFRGRRGFAPGDVRDGEVAQGREVVACGRVRVCREMYRMMPGRRGSMGCLVIAPVWWFLTSR